MKVNSKNEWSEIEKEIGFPEKCVNSELALKHIYIRYFDKYERVNFLGEEKDRIDEDEEENRHKRWSARALHSIPSSYNHSHHNVNFSVRESNKLSTNLYQASEYDKLAMSLLSPLPNEQDFAINVLTLMSNECKQTLRLNKCPRLIGILLAHAGCFEHHNLREMFNEFYARVRGHSLDTFWRDTLNEKPDFYYLMYEDIFNNEEENDLKKAPKSLPTKELEEHNFFALKRQLGTQDYIGQRVHQVMTIIRNLSFFEENILILAHDRTLIRFLVMCANIRWSNIHMMALDVLGNICGEVELRDPFADLTSRHLFGTICDEIESNDRATIISTMEVLSKLCSKEENEDFLLRNIKREDYKSVSTYLLVPDMMLLVYTLECIYSLTSLGEKACNAFVDIHGFVDTIVSLITLEAQSLGSDSCIQMKVIETVPTRQVFQTRAHVMPQNVLVQKGNIPDQQRAMYQSPTKFAPNQTQISADALVKQNQQQQYQENEQFAIAWIKNNFELSPSLMVKIEEHDMYRMYLNACTKIGRKGVISQVHFPRVVRSIFGGSVGPNPNNADPVVNYYCGIKPRAMTLPTPTTNAEGTVVKTEVQVSIKTEESTLAAQLKAPQSVKYF
jgi:AT-rich interactive domain-containing protein 2